MCFHIAMTTAIYAGGISLTSYPVVCQAVSAQLYAALALSPVVCAFAAWSDCNVRQVGIALHYSSLSTLLWIGVSARVIYKEAVWRTPRQPEGEPAAVPTQRPMLRSVGEARRHLAFTSFFRQREIAVCCQRVHVKDRCRSHGGRDHPGCAPSKWAIVPIN